jgi:hypothetical protein
MAGARSITDRISYADLYERWERGNWRATELDFSFDREHWRDRFTDTQRRAALWNYSLFMHGEDSVADNLSPYIDAAPREEQKYFLATQQVDEVRHAVFFSRFMREVVEDGSESIAESLERSRRELTWGFRELFALLDRTADGLRRDRSLPNLAAAITLYHIVVEAAVAQTGQHFIASYLERDELMPGFREGIENVAADEQRHIGFGVKMLSDLVREDPECKDAVADILREAVRYAVALFVPPNWDLSYIECFGSTLENLYEQGLGSLRTKLRSAGLPLEELPGAVPLPPELDDRGQAERALRVAKANLMGEPGRPISREPEDMALLFDAIARSVDPRETPPHPATIQWDFADAPAWHVHIDNGRTSAVQGNAENPDVTFRCTYGDWVDIATGREDPARALLTRKVRPSGSPRMLLRTRKLFAR